jgi:hypothetical protein
LIATPYFSRLLLVFPNTAISRPRFPACRCRARMRSCGNRSADHGSLLSRAPYPLKLRRTTDYLDRQGKAVNLIIDRQLHRRINIALFLVSPHVHVAVAGATICQAVNQRGVAMEIEDNHITAIRLPRFRRYFKRQPNRPPQLQNTITIPNGAKSRLLFPKRFSTRRKRRGSPKRPSFRAVQEVRWWQCSQVSDQERDWGYVTAAWKFAAGRDSRSRSPDLPHPASTPTACRNSSTRSCEAWQRRTNSIL